MIKVYKRNEFTKVFDDVDSAIEFMDDNNYKMAVTYKVDKEITIVEVK